MLVSMLSQRLTKWTTIKMDDDQNRRQSKWTTIKMDGTQNGRSSKWTTIKMDGQEMDGTIKIDENKPCLRALQMYFQYNILYLNTFVTWIEWIFPETFRTYHLVSIYRFFYRFLILVKSWIRVCYYILLLEQCSTPVTLTIKNGSRDSSLLSFLTRQLTD